jgi:hypothetical protein
MSSVLEDIIQQSAERASRQNKAQDCSLYETRPAATQTHNREIFKVERLFGAHCCCSARRAEKASTIEEQSASPQTLRRTPATLVNY